MKKPNVICLVVDRLQTGMLGAYGNTWIHTPEIDRLAGSAFLFDQAFADDARLERVYRALWQGLHTLETKVNDDPSATLIERLAASGMHTALLTDDAAVDQLPFATHFKERQRIDSHPVERLTSELEETQLANFFATASQWLAAPPESFCLWLHTRGMAGDWDAPLELRQQYADPEDPPSPDFTAVPTRELDDDADADELLGIAHAYAAQVSVLDTCLGALLDAVDDAGLADSTLLVLLSARGFALGEHRRVGPDDTRLFGETTQLAWVMRFPDGLGHAARTQALVQPADLPATILAWLGLPAISPSPQSQSLLPLVTAERETLRDALVCASPIEAALRTPAWLLKMPQAGQHGAAELYVKPSDRYEVSEVANRCPDIASTLQAILSEILQTGQIPVSALAEALTEPVD